MTIPAPDAPAPPSIGMAALFMSVVAILMLTLALFLVASAAGSLVAVVLFGVAEVSGFMDRVKGASLAQGEPALVFMMQVVGLALYVCHIAAIWLIGTVGAKMPLARRVAWLDWGGDRQFWLLLAATIAYALAADAIATWFVPDLRQTMALPKDGIGLSISLVAVCLAGPIAEELFFRGWIYTAMRARYSFALTLMATSVLFALAHYESTHVYALVIFPVGAAFGFVRERYGSIKASAFFHALYNLFGWTGVFLGFN